MYELKIYRGFLRHDNEEWCKIWREINLSIQNSHEKFLKILTQTLENLKILRFNGLLLTKVHHVWAKESNEELFLMALNTDTKFEGKMTWGI